MNKDVTTCCKSNSKPVDTKKRKRVVDESESDNDSEDEEWNKRRSRKKKNNAATTSNPPPAMPKLGSEIQIKKVPPKTTEKPIQSESVEKKITPPAKKKAQPPPPPPPPQPKPAVVEEPSSEVECTPDLFDFLVNRSFAEQNDNEEQVIGELSVTRSRTPPVAQSTPKPPARMTANIPPKPAQSSLRIQNVVSGPAARAMNTGSNSGQRMVPANRQQVIKTIVRQDTQNITNSPVFHMYNGFKIDLNTAAQQSTMKLPNGKIIHVRKQPTITGSAPRPRMQTAITATRLRASLQAPRVIPSGALRRVAPNTNIRGPPPLLVHNQPHQIPQQILRPQQAPQQMVRTAYAPMPTQTNQFYPGLQTITRPPMVQYQPQLQAPIQQQIRMQQQQQMPGTGNVQYVNQPPNANMAQPQAMQPRLYANDQVGKARTQLERQIFNAIEICHQIDGKLKTLMNSNAYKNANKLNDVKELYIHLSYLFTYTNGRFRTLQDKCMDDLRKLGFKNDAKNLMSGNVIDKYGSDCDEDDMEIVEPNHTTINLDSDDEQSTSEQTPTKKKSLTPRQTSSTIQTNEPNDQAVAETIENTEDVDTSTEQIECDVDIASLLAPQVIMNEEDDDDELIEPMVIMHDDNEIETPQDAVELLPPSIQDVEQINGSTPDVVLSNDAKLMSAPKVVLTRVEHEYPDIIAKLNNHGENKVATDDGEIASTSNNVQSSSEEKNSPVNTDQKDAKNGAKESDEVIEQIGLNVADENQIETVDLYSSCDESQTTTNITAESVAGEIEVECNINDNVETSMNVASVSTVETENENESKTEPVTVIEMISESEEVVPNETEIETVETPAVDETVEAPTIDDKDTELLDGDSIALETINTIVQSISVDSTENSTKNDDGNDEGAEELKETVEIVDKIVEKIVEEMAEDGSHCENNIEIDGCVEQNELELISNEEVSSRALNEIDAVDGEESFEEASLANVIEEISSKLEQEISEKFPINAKDADNPKGAVTADATAQNNDDFENISSPDIFNNYEETSNENVAESCAETLNNFLNNSNFANIPMN